MTKRPNTSKKIIGITMGDPAGIGPEVVAQALTKPSIRRRAQYVIIGDAGIYQKYSSRLHANCSFVDCQNVPLKKLRIGKETALGGGAALEYLQRGVAMVKNRAVASLVTAPLSKEAVSLHTKQHFQGHTEYLANAFGVKKVEMMFVSRGLRMIIATRHLPLKKVPSAITPDKLYKTIQLTHDGLKKLFKIKRPKIGICGLNPHAGEGGKMGQEEIAIITPTVKKARKHHIHIEGPFAADTMFTPDVYRHYDVIIAMYHDQGLVGVKTMCFNKLVNLTIGLPFVRTSTAHGTAFNIAGQNKADPSSMCEAIKLAADLT